MSEPPSQPIIVHGLWIGETLGEMQLRTLRSFLAQGCQFHLWVYQAPSTPLPPGVILRNAATVIPVADVFCYPADGPIDMPFGRGSYAGFSDIFRYKLLYEEGGWYSDLDVTCLKPPLFETEYVFRSHWQFPTVGNIMRCPRGSELMRRCYEIAKEAVTPQNREWNLPIRILNEQVVRLGLERYIRQDICNSDSPRELRELMTGTKPIPRQWHFVHWCAALGVVDDGFGCK